MFRRIARCSPAIAAGALLALALAAGSVYADIGGPVGDSWGRVLAYAGCALSLAAATTGLGVAAAAIACVRILTMTF